MRWKERVRQLKTEIFAMYLAYRDPRVPWAARIFIALIIGYAISPLDLIPDFIPILGQLDDMILLPLGLLLVRRMIPPAVLAECREKAAGFSGKIRPAAWIITLVKLLGLLIGLYALRFIALLFFPRSVRLDLSVRYGTIGLIYLIFLTVALLVIIRDKELRQRVGLVFPENNGWLWYAVGMGLGLGGLATIVTVVGRVSSIVAQTADTSTLILVGMGVIVGAPLLEELVFRGILFACLLHWMPYLQPRPEWPAHIGAIFLTALLFSLSHLGVSIGFLVVLFLGGLLYGWVRWKTGTIGPSLIGHIAWNGGLALGQLMLQIS